MPRSAHISPLATLATTTLAMLAGLAALTLTGCNSAAQTGQTSGQTTSGRSAPTSPGAPTPSSTAAPAAVTQPSTPTSPTSGGRSASAFPLVHEDWAKLGYRLDWVGFPFMGAARGSRVIDILPAGDVVIAQESGSTVTLMSSATGSNRWSTDLTGPLTKWVGMIQDNTDPERFVVASESEGFVIAKANGNLIAREKFERVANTKPVQDGRMLIFGTSTGQVMSHLMGSGVSAWAFTSVGSFDTDLVRVGPYIGAVSQGGDVLVLTPRGELVGRARVFGPVDSRPVSDGQSIFVASRDQSIWAFASTGATLWRHRTSNPITAQPTSHDGVIYCHLRQEGMTALDANTGNVIWQNPAAKGQIIAVRSGRLLAWDGVTLATLDPARGDIVNAAQLPGVTRIVTDAFIDGNLYAASDSGVLARFIPR